MDIPPILLGAIFLIIIIVALLIPRLLSKIRRPIKWRNILILAIVILIVLGIFYAVTQIPSEQKELTEEQKEIDNFLDKYYDALRSKSISKISEHFTENAVIISSEDITYRGTEMIKRYYDDKLRNLDRYEVKTEVSKIEIQDGSAEAVYHTKRTRFITGQTMPPLEAFQEEFTLIRQQDSWKITGLVITREKVS
ncbi:MAG: nuclear transport factor 2 family protein [Candidatus Bathyarchaeota archaeon]|nr:nuclear transport factor 2 family protein [Candidatus Bathyarchaeota archaeon]